MPSVSVKDAVVFVTGANRGIGRAIADELLAYGAKKVYAAARNVDGVQDLVEEHPDRVVPAALDVTDSEQIIAVASQATDVQIVINNAGVARSSGFVYRHNPDAARLEMETNYFGPLNVARAFAEAVVGNGNGAIVNISSISALTNFPPLATYSASKAASHSLTQGLRAELGPQGVGVFGVYPGPIDTDMAAGLEFDKESPQNVARRIFDDMANGVEDIMTDAFAATLSRNLKLDAKAVERENAKLAYPPDS